MDLARWQIAPAKAGVEALVAGQLDAVVGEVAAAGLDHAVAVPGRQDEEGPPQAPGRTCDEHSWHNQCIPGSPHQAILGCAEGAE